MMPPSCWSLYLVLGGCNHRAGVKPNFISKSLSGAEAAESRHADPSRRSDRHSDPSRSPNPSRPKPAPTISGGRTLIAVGLSCCSNSSHDGMLTTRAAMPSAELLVGLDAKRDLAAGADQDHSRLAVRRRRPEHRRPARRRRRTRTRAVERRQRLAASARGRPAGACSLHDDAPGLDDFVGVGRPQHDQAGNGAQRRPAARPAGGSVRLRRRRSSRG